MTQFCKGDIISTCKQLPFYASFINNWPTPTKPAWFGSVISLNNTVYIKFFKMVNIDNINKTKAKVAEYFGL